MQVKIIVCIKPIQVNILYPNEKRNEKYVVNPYDMYALKEVLRIKKEIDCTVICLCMGEISAKQALTKCLGMGADQAILLSDKLAFAQSDTVATSKILSHAIQRITPYDLIVCGQRSVDGETGQVKYGMGELLDIASITCVDSIINIDSHSLVVRTSNAGYANIVQGHYPLLISFQGVSTIDSNPVGILQLSRAYKTAIPIWDVSDLGIPLEECGYSGSRTEVIGTERIARNSKQTVVEGSDKHKADFIRTLIAEHRRE